MDDLKNSRQDKIISTKPTLDNATMSDPQHQAIVFADVSGSSALYKRVGNNEAKGLIDNAIEAMRAITHQWQGRVVKTIGDEIMACFSNVDNACAAAQSMQKDCEEHNSLSGLSLRIGISYGDVIEDGDNDVFGEAVNDAAYVTSIARARQVVLTQSVNDAVSKAVQKQCQEFDKIRIKGSLKRTTIYRLEWETKSLSDTYSHSATTVLHISDVNQRLAEVGLTLRHNHSVQHITPDITPFIIGRDQRKSNLHINNGLASREHCHIIHRRGKYVLVDHSTNGTYVTQPDQPEIYLRREELPLTGKGIIAIGQHSADCQGGIIEFEL